MHHAQAQPLRVRQARQLAERFFLRRPRQAGLEPDQVERAAVGVLLAQLHHGVRRAAGARVAQPDRLERAEAQRVLAARGQLLDRQAALEVRHVARRGVGFEAFGLVLGQRAQVVDEAQVGLAVERDVEVVVAVALVVARLAVHRVQVERVERRRSARPRRSSAAARRPSASIAAASGSDGQRPAGDRSPRRLGGIARHLFAPDLDVGQRREARGSTSALNRSRSTASAPPAGTAASRADVTISESSRASSSLSSPTAFSSAAPRSELRAHQLRQRRRCGGPARA